MSKRLDPAAVALEFFQTAPPEVASAVLALCVAAVKKRTTPSTKRAPRAPRAPAGALLNGGGHAAD